MLPAMLKPRPSTVSIVTRPTPDYARPLSTPEPAPNANEQQIDTAVARCPNSALRQDATSVLTVTPHRETYDALHGTLSDIGRLRARLGLTHGAHWQGDVANDFHCLPTTPFHAMTNWSTESATPSRYITVGEGCAAPGCWSRYLRWEQAWGWPLALR